MKGLSKLRSAYDTNDTIVVFLFGVDNFISY